MANISPLNTLVINGAVTPQVADDCEPVITRLPGSVPNASPLGSWVLNGRGGAIVTQCEKPAGTVFDPLARTEIYLLLVDGVQVPMSSFQATMRSEGKSFVQAVLPAEGQLPPFEYGALMKVQLGYYYPDAGEYSGLETIAEAPLEIVRSDEGPGRFTVTVSGYGPLPEYAPSQRKLRGVRARSISQGKRRVRCNVDLLLRPKHYAADTDGATFQVDTIQYFVNSASAAMEITERG